MVDINLGKALEATSSKLQRWLNAFVALLPNLALAVVAVVSFYVAARVARRLMSKVFPRISGNITLNRLTSNLIYMLVNAAGAFIALTILNLDRALLSVLAGLGIVGLALSLAFQDIATNLFSGIVLALQSPFEVGDLVQTNDFFGKVLHINLRTTVLATPQGQDVIIPNKDVFQKPFINYSKQGRRRVDLQVGVSYGENLDQVNETTVAAVASVPGALSDPPIELFFQEFGNGSINLSVRFWIDFSLDDAAYQSARSEAIMRIKRAYAAAGITIPFPITTLDFGIKGGTPLSEMLSRTSAR